MKKEKKKELGKEGKFEVIIEKQKKGKYKLRPAGVKKK